MGDKITRLYDKLCDKFHILSGLLVTNDILFPYKLSFKIGSVVKSYRQLRGMRNMGINDLLTVLQFAGSPLVLLAVIFLAGKVSQAKKASENIVSENKQAEPVLSPAD